MRLAGQSPSELLKSNLVEEFLGFYSNLPSCRSPGGFLNLISLSDGQAMPVRLTGMGPWADDDSISVSLKSELAIAPQGTIAVPLSFTSNGLQSLETGEVNSPSN